MTTGRYIEGQTLAAKYFPFKGEGNSPFNVLQSAKRDAWFQGWQDRGRADEDSRGVEEDRRWHEEMD